MIYRWLLGTIIDYHPQTGKIRIKTMENNAPMYYEIDRKHYNWLASPGRYSVMLPSSTTTLETSVYPSLLPMNTTHKASTPSHGLIIHAPTEGETFGHRKSLLERLFRPFKLLRSKDKIDRSLQPNNYSHEEPRLIKLPPPISTVHLPIHTGNNSAIRRFHTEQEGLYIGSLEEGGKEEEETEEADETDQEKIEGTIDKDINSNIFPVNGTRQKNKSPPKKIGYKGGKMNTIQSYYPVEEVRTPSPIRGRRRKYPILYVGQPVDILYHYNVNGKDFSNKSHLHDNTPSSSSSSSSSCSYPEMNKSLWLPGRIVALSGQLVHVQVYVPPFGSMQGTQTVANYLLNLSTEPTNENASNVSLSSSSSSSSSAVTTSNNARIEDIIIHIRDTPLRLSFPSGLRSGVSGDDIKTLWPTYSNTTEITNNRRTTTRSLSTVSTSVSTIPIGNTKSGENTNESMNKHRTRIHAPSITGLEIPVTSAPNVLVTKSLITPHTRPSLPKEFCSVDMTNVSTHHFPSSLSNTSIPAVEADFILTLKTGMEVDALSINEISKRLEQQKWACAVVIALHTDGAMLICLRADERIGRGGFPIYPTLLAVDVLYTHNATVETIPILSGRLLPVHTKTLNEPLHSYEIGTFVDVVKLIEIPRFSIPDLPLPPPILPLDSALSLSSLQTIPTSIVSINHHHHRLVSRTELDLPTTRLISEWRWAEIIEIAYDMVCVRYYNDEDSSVNGTEEWINMITEGYRLRPHGSITDIESEEERKRKEEDELFIDALSNVGWKVIPTNRDGNCLFSAVAFLIYGDVLYHSRVRAEIVQYIIENMNYFGPIIEAFDYTFDNYINLVSRNTEWGGYIELIACEEVYDRKIEIFHSEDYYFKGILESRGIHFHDEIPQSVTESSLYIITPLRLSYHGSNHYASVLPNDDQLSKYQEEQNSITVPSNRDRILPPLGSFLNNSLHLLRNNRIQRFCGTVDKENEEIYKAKTAAEIAVREGKDEVIRRHIRRSTLALIHYRSLSGEQKEDEDERERNG